MSAGSVSHHYNPDWLDDDALVAGFVAREGEFVFLRDELARAPREGSVQHYLLVGPRGAGKTTLLKRLAVAIRRDVDLNDHLIALSFPEELYQVKGLSDFWWAACEALADELDRLGQVERSQSLFAEVDRARTGPKASVPLADPQADAGLTRLLETCAEVQRRPVLLVDNLDFIFERIDKQGRKRKDPLSPTYWALREALSKTRSPIVVGCSVRLSEPFTDYDKAFYDFFLTKRLGKLPLDEVRRVLEQLADRQGLPEVKARLDARPARIEALYELTGGNPRAIGLIFELLRQGPNGHAVQDFERLMDLTTPYYKHRFEDLPEQAQVVMHALAVRRPGDGGGLRFGHTAAEVGAHAGLPTNTVSAQMDVLEREGLIEKSAAHGRTQYRIAEQLFRLWLQMRGTRRVRQSVIGLAEFLEAMFDVDELTAQLQGAGSGLAEARFTFAVADVRAAAPLRRGLEAHGADRLLSQIWTDGGDLDELLPPGDLPEDLGAIVRLRDRLRQCKGGGLTAEEQDALLGAVTLRIEQKATSVDALCGAETAAAEAACLRPRLAAERGRLLRWGLLDSDLPQLYRLRVKGQLPLPWLTPGDAKVACGTAAETGLQPLVWRLVGARELVKVPDEVTAMAWLDWGRSQVSDASSVEWANVAGTMRRSRQFGVACQALDHACEQGESARAWYERAALSGNTGGDPREAEVAFRTAVELGPADAYPWHGLGILLAERLGRPDEAEAAYRKAIELEPEYAPPWNGLGNLLADKLGRPYEAEAAYRKAIELDPASALPWNNLGNVLAKRLGRPGEAEAAYRKAIELDPASALLWNNLGILLADKLGRLAEAEAAYRKAIKLAPAFANPWNGLGNLLADKLGRPDEAEAAYRKAIELDPALGMAWGNLGNLMEEQSRFDEALGAFAQAATLDSKNDSFWQLCVQALKARLRAAGVRKALQLGDLAATRDALIELLSTREDLAATLAGTDIVEGMLSATLTDERRATAMLGMLWWIGFDKYARPLVLAFEAAVHNRPESLDELEPEVRGAARRLYDRLLAGRQASARG